MTNLHVSPTMVLDASRVQDISTESPKATADGREITRLSSRAEEEAREEASGMLSVFSASQVTTCTKLRSTHCSLALASSMACSKVDTLMSEEWLSKKA